MRIFVAVAAICKSYIGKFLIRVVGLTAHGYEGMALDTIDFDMFTSQLILGAIMIKA